MLEGIIGQELLKRHIGLALEGDRFSHAYLLTGLPGTGKRTIARQLAMSVLCMASGSDKPCGKCRSCLQLLENKHPDVRLVRPDKESIRIQQIREAIEGISTKPLQGPYTVIIIEQADRMNVQAQNALLKTLEEPPAHVMLILTSDNDANILPTVFSRCLQYHVHPLSREELFALHTSKGGTLSPQAETAAELSQGAYGRFAEILEDASVLELREDFFRMMDDIAKGKPTLVYPWIEKAGEEPGKLPDVYELCLRDLLSIRVAEGVCLINADKEAELRRLAGLFSSERINNMLKVTAEVRAALQQNMNKKLAVEKLFISYFSPEAAEGIRRRG